MKIQFFRKRQSKYGLRERIRRSTELALKCSSLLLIPAVPMAAILAIWYFVIFRFGWYFDERMETIVTSAWVQTFGVVYSLMAAAIFNSVWEKYKAIRAAAKRYDLETFVDLSDEDMSPLVYTMMTVFSISILAVFMSMKYPNVKCGLIIIGSTSYLFSLIFLVIKEIDEPCGGIWFIKSIPPEWLSIDPKSWRQERHKREREKFKGKIREHNGNFEIEGFFERENTVPAKAR